MLVILWWCSSVTYREHLSSRLYYTIHPLEGQVLFKIIAFALVSQPLVNPLLYSRNGNCCRCSANDPLRMARNHGHASSADFGSARAASAAAT